MSSSELKLIFILFKYLWLIQNRLVSLSVNIHFKFNVKTYFKQLQLLMDVKASKSSKVYF